MINEDNMGEKEEALQWSKSGIAELEKGIAVEIRGQGDQRDQKET